MLATAFILEAHRYRPDFQDAGNMVEKMEVDDDSPKKQEEEKNKAAEPEKAPDLDAITFES